MNTDVVSQKPEPSSIYSPTALNESPPRLVTQRHGSSANEDPSNGPHRLPLLSVACTLVCMVAMHNALYAAEGEDERRSMDLRVLSEQDGLLCLSDSDQPYTGTGHLFDARGLSVAEIKAGTLHGVTLEFATDGTPKSISTWVNGEASGLFCDFDNDGKLISIDSVQTIMRHADKGEVALLNGAVVGTLVRGPDGKQVLVAVTRTKRPLWRAGEHDRSEVASGDLEQTNEAAPQKTATPNE